MKIAFLSEKYTPDTGGLAISSGRLANLLTADGHTVKVFAPSAGLPTSEKRILAHNRVTVTRFGPHKRMDDTLVDWFELLIDVHRRDPFDIFHAYFLPQAGFVAAYAGNFTGIPSVVSARGNDLERAIFDPARSAHILYALQNASAVTTNASELSRKAQALVPNLDVTIIPNGVDGEHFRPLPRNEALSAALGLGSRPVIGFAGELRAKKGISTLLEAFKKLAKKTPASLLIVGDLRPGDDRARFDEFRQANPDLHVVVTGFVSPADLPAYYALMDVFIHPSLRDGLPNALLEAMACEKAVVATPVGGITDVVIDHKNGVFIPVNDPDALAGAIQTLLADESLRQKLGQAARETILQKFTPRQELEMNLGIYKRLGM